MKEVKRKVSTPKRYIMMLHHKLMRSISIRWSEEELSVSVFTTLKPMSGWQHRPKITQADLNQIVFDLLPETWNPTYSKLITVSEHQLINWQMSYKCTDISSVYRPVKTATDPHLSMATLSTACPVGSNWTWPELLVGKKNHPQSLHQWWATWQQRKIEREQMIRTGTGSWRRRRGYRLVWVGHSRKGQWRGRGRWERGRPRASRRRGQ